MKPVDALSVVASAADLARFHETQAQKLDWPMEQLRRGGTLPTSVVLDLLDGLQQSHRRVGAHALLVATMIAQSSAPPPPLIPWWRRWFRRRAGP